jgi:hypothetical protein
MGLPGVCCSGSVSSLSWFSRSRCCRAFSALLTGGKLFGFLGVLVSLPAAAVIGLLVRFALGRFVTA